MKCAKFGLYGVIFSLLLVGCGAKKRQHSPEEVVKDEAKVRVVSFESGVENCPTRDARKPRTDVSTRIMTIEVPKKAQRIQHRDCSGKETIFSTFYPVSLDLGAAQGAMNFVEVRNLTTCTSGVRVQGKVQAGAEMLGKDKSDIDANDFMKWPVVEVLPVGKTVRLPIQDLVFDLKRVNVLDVTYKTCFKFAANDASKCEESMETSEERILVSMVHDGRHERDHRIEEDKDCVRR